MHHIISYHLKFYDFFVFLQHKKDIIYSTIYVIYLHNMMFPLNAIIWNSNSVTARKCDVI